MRDTRFYGRDMLSMAGDQGVIVDAKADNAAAPAPISGIWGRIWRFIQACEMSSAEYRDRRIDALERGIAELRMAPQETSRDGGSGSAKPNL